MPKLTPRTVQQEAFTDVKVSWRADARWTDEQLADRQHALNVEWCAMRNRSQEVAMPRVTESSYRENAGRESLTISLAEDGWQETFEFLGSTPARRFVEFGTDEFVGTNASGDESVPASATILKTFHREALRRGFVLGVQTHTANGTNGVPSDAFRVVLRRNVKEYPKTYQTMIADGVEQDLIEA